MKITKRQSYWLEIITKCGGVFKYYNNLGNPSYQILNSEKEIDKKMVERRLTLLEFAIRKYNNPNLLSPEDIIDLISEFGAR